ncbi:glutamate ABC transporter substrate-binding protein [Kitasatospora sp. NPDC004531]
MNQRYILRALALALALPGLAAGLSGCGKEGTPPPKGPQPEALPSYEVRANTVTGSPTLDAARARGHLVVGAKEDQPYLGQKNPATGEYSGFDIEIARMVAADLGFGPDRIEFRTIASANRETALQNGQVDYYVGTYTINANRKKLVGFAGPYFIAGQALMVRKSETKINGPQDLAGRKVCSAAGSTPYQRIKNDYPKAELIGYDTYSACVDNLISNQVDAVTTDNAILQGYVAKVPDELKMVGEPFSTEPYGIGVPKNDTVLRMAINDALQRNMDNGNWKKAYDATLGLSGVPAPPPPAIDRYN